ncbi:NINE protein [Cohnella sp. AR92]|uniref:NINE protein n=1 Tax=Cohnella sp. AR92 TaxID=648716 RepID=UPI001EDFDC50|nr:TM2 domain-containing protein [Cohnella sp. AR92]
MLNSEMRLREKSIALVYILLLGGHLGIHRFYLKKPLSGSIQLALSVLATIFYFIFALTTAEAEDYGEWWAFVLCLLCAAAVFVWVIVDLFLIPKMVKRLNEEKEQEIVKQLLEYRNLQSFR